MQSVFRSSRSNAEELKLNIQTGMRLTVGAITPNHPSDILLEDFNECNKIKLPRQGGLRTPAHKSSSFKFKDYAPKVFRSLRNRFGVDAADYMVSLCGEHSLTGLPSPGKSGSMFYFSHDRTYVIKTMSKSESKFLRSILPEYYNHFVKHPHTLITRYFGLHRVNPRHSKKTHIVIMNNLFDTDYDLHAKYDLKGSTVGRQTKPAVGSELSNETTLKDLDLIKFRRQLYLEPRKRALLMEQLKLDCQFLASLGLMDYSLLLGIHVKNTVHKPLTSTFCSPKTTERCPAPVWDKTPTRLGIENVTRTDSSGSELPEPASSVDLDMGPVVTAEQRKTMSHHFPVVVRENTNVMSIPLHEAPNFRIADLTVPHPMLLQHLTKNMLVSVFQSEDGGMWSSDGTELYFVGVIDLLTKWNGLKVVENRIKGVVYDPAQVSAVAPEDYANRFLQFMADFIVDQEPRPVSATEALPDVDSSEDGSRSSRWAEGEGLGLSVDKPET